jgi:hypothetical protein
MSEKRKHRIVIEATFNEPVTEKMATAMLYTFLEDAELEDAITYKYRDVHIYCENFTVKRFSKVFSAKAVLDSEAL